MPVRAGARKMSDNVNRTGDCLRLHALPPFWHTAFEARLIAAQRKLPGASIYLPRIGNAKFRRGNLARFALPRLYHCLPPLTSFAVTGGSGNLRQRNILPPADGGA